MGFPFRKTDAFIAGTDLDSGMQRATVNGGIGTDPIPPEFIPGSSIAGVFEPQYHQSYILDSSGNDAVTMFASLTPGRAAGNVAAGYDAAPAAYGTLNNTTFDTVTVTGIWAANSAVNTLVIETSAQLSPTIRIALAELDGSPNEGILLTWNGTRYEGLASSIFQGLFNNFNIPNRIVLWVP
jgi:hypothetical protein